VKVREIIIVQAPGQRVKEERNTGNKRLALDGKGVRKGDEEDVIGRL
jgi:hypothetical protein